MSRVHIDRHYSDSRYCQQTLHLIALPLPNISHHVRIQNCWVNSRKCYYTSDYDTNRGRYTYCILYCHCLIYYHLYHILI